MTVENVKQHSFSTPQQAKHRTLVQAKSSAGLCRPGISDKYEVVMGLGLGAQRVASTPALWSLGGPYTSQECQITWKLAGNADSHAPRQPY